MNRNFPMLFLLNKSLKMDIECERKKYPDGDNRLNWFVIDGTNYQYLRELLVETFGYEKTKYSALFI